MAMYQIGNGPTAIALRCGLDSATVQNFLKSPRAIAYRLEQEEATDQLMAGLYRDGAEALRRALVHPDLKYSLKAAELVFKVLGKMKPEGAESDGPQVHIDKILQIIQQPPSTQELKEAKQYCATRTISAPTQTVSRAVADSE